MHDYNHNIVQLLGHLIRVGKYNGRAVVLGRTVGNRLACSECVVRSHCFTFNCSYSQPFVFMDRAWARKERSYGSA
jgi:hypothetical protein